MVGRIFGQKRCLHVDDAMPKGRRRVELEYPARAEQGGEATFVRGVVLLYFF